VVQCEPDPGSSEHLRIVELEERKTSLARPDRRGHLKPVAANLSRLLIVCAPLPQPDPLLLDQFCIVALNNGFEPVLVVNKADLLEEAKHADAAEVCRALLDAYSKAGFETLTISTQHKGGCDAIVNSIENQVAALVGQSGVGKSSIIKTILPDQEIRIGAVSQATGIGAHTTTVSFWYDLENHGVVIDSPGVRQFAVDYLEPREVVQGYPEILKLADDCRFYDCKHTVEPDCAVKAALESGAESISSLRYNNYLKLLSS